MSFAGNTPTGPVVVLGYFFKGGGLAKICVLTKPLVINIALNTKLQFIYVVIEL